MDVISPRILRILTGYYDRPCSSSSFVRSFVVRSFVVRRSFVRGSFVRSLM